MGYLLCSFAFSLRAELGMFLVLAELASCMDDARCLATRCVPLVYSLYMVTFFSSRAGLPLLHTEPCLGVVSLFRVASTDGNGNPGWGDSCRPLRGIVMVTMQLKNDLFLWRLDFRSTALGAKKYCFCQGSETHAIGLMPYSSRSKTKGVS